MTDADADADTGADVAGTGEKDTGFAATDAECAMASTHLNAPLGADSDYAARQAVEGWWDSPTQGHPDGSGRNGRNGAALGGFMSPLRSGMQKQMQKQREDIRLGRSRNAAPANDGRPVVRVRPIVPDTLGVVVGVHAPHAQRSLVPVPKRSL